MHHILTYLAMVDNTIYKAFCVIVDSTKYASHASDNNEYAICMLSASLANDSESHA